jgi:nitrilase
MVVVGPEGVVHHRHRKLMPTAYERFWYGFGRGDDLDVISLPFARVGALICWENRMPLARYAVYQRNPQILGCSDRGQFCWLARADERDRLGVGRLCGSGPLLSAAFCVPARLPRAAPSAGSPDGLGGLRAVTGFTGSLIR